MNPAPRMILFIMLLPLLANVPCLKAAEKKHGQAHVENDYWDFGYVPIDYKLIHVYRIKNVGDGDLNIIKAVSGCDCTSAIVSRKIIPPDSIAEVKIFFDTKNYYGKNTRSVIVETDDPESPSIELKYDSNIGLFPKFYRTEPRSLFFLPGHSGKVLKLINNTDDDIDYGLIVEPDSIFHLDRTDGRIKSGDFANINVKPKGELSRGTHFANLRVTYYTEQDIYITVPVKIVKY
jgi:hypothetical protein